MHLFEGLSTTLISLRYDVNLPVTPTNAAVDLHVTPTNCDVTHVMSGLYDHDDGEVVVLLPNTDTDKQNGIAADGGKEGKRSKGINMGFTVVINALLPRHGSCRFM